MTEFVEKNHEEESFSLGMAFLAFLMAIAALNGIWFLALLLKMLVKMFN